MKKGSKATKETLLKLSKSKLGRRDYQKKAFCKHGHNISLVGRVNRGEGISSGTCLLCLCIRAARVRDFSFELSEKQYIEIINKECIYACPSCNKVGVDRIDSELGYTIENCQPMCGNHNIMKNRFETSKFKELCSSVG